jgi:DNA adenine methylase
MNTTKLKTPITYYGGKQRLAKKIISLISPHITYVEPFAGGLAVFFKKEPSQVECINDKNGELINFYKVLKHNFNELQYLIEETLYSRQMYNEAKNIYRNPQGHNPIKRAWAIFVCCNQGYGAHLDEGWGFERKGNNHIKKYNNKIKNFTEIYQKRLENTQIECFDSLKVIKNFDTENTFFYIDPPYINTDQGCYKGYTENDYKNLLELLTRQYTY